MKTKFKVTFSLFAIFAFSIISFAQDVSIGGGGSTEPFGQVKYPESGTITITQSLDPDSVLEYGSIACRNPNNNYTAENHYWRSFVLTDFEITDSFNVTLVDIGIQQALAGSGGSQPLTCNLYITDGTPFPGGYPNSLILIGTTTLQVPDRAVAHFQIPVKGTVPAGSELVVEILIPNGQLEGNIFIIGINHFGETAQSYFSSAGCDFPIPVPPPVLPDQHYVMSVIGNVTTPADPLFEEKVDYYVGLRPNTVVSGDFDNDGDIDLAASPNTEHNPDGKGLVTILKNNSDGTFFLADSLLVGDAPNLLAVNFDGDTDKDLVVSDWYPPYQMYLISNDGSGNFAITDSFPSYGTQAHLLCAADFDNDNYIDLAVPNSASGNLGLFFNNGDGSFALPPPLLTVGSSPICALPGDLDTNGYVDLVVSLANEGSIRVLLNDGTGNFPVGTNYQTGSVPFAHSLADYNGDGCLDVAVPNVLSDSISVMFGDCTGAFGSKVNYPGCHPILAASADLDNDGDIDLAVSNNECNTISIYLNNGDGTFPPNPSFNLEAGNGPVGITANDFDNDGDVDLAVSNFDILPNLGVPGNTVSVFINRTNRTITIPVELTFFTATNNGSLITLNWTTATETNNQMFEIQRRISDNDQNGEWITIGYREGKGTTTEPQNYSYIDDISGMDVTSLSYRLKQIDFDGSYSFSEEVLVSNLAPNGFVLEQNYPNPFNPSTSIKYSIGNRQFVTLKIYDVLGNEIETLVDEEKPAGTYEVEFNSHSGNVRNLTSGVYFYKLQAGTYVETKKMVLMK